MSEVVSPTTIEISYEPSRLTGELSLSGMAISSIWERIKQYVVASGGEYRFSPNRIELSWTSVLSVVREFGPQQRSLNFRFRPVGQAKEKISEFVEQYKSVQRARSKLSIELSTAQIGEMLRSKGFTRRELKPFQLRDLQRLAALPNGANFSVPGAGKTTVTLALHVLIRRPGQKLLIVCPKSAFPAWREVVQECIAPDAADGNAEPFTVLSGSSEKIERSLRSDKTRFVINYDLMIQIPDVITSFLARNPVHLVLDESHRMKAGTKSQRGALLLGVAALPIRRDILSGTPMPQSPSDIQSQLDFLWPGTGLALDISRGKSPRDVLGELYVRTTKQELGLPKPNRCFVKVEMSPGQMALYGIVRDEALREFSKLNTAKGLDIVGAKRSVMRLLQLSANPVLALRSMAISATGLDSGIIDEVLAEGPSTKMVAVADLVRSLAKVERKSVVWTIFTDTITQMERLLADLNPVALHGAVASGDPEDTETREGRIRRFHIDPACKVLIANPAAAGEGISLHQVCHEAIYLDRSYVTTHYLQSIDRIHRLGLDPDVQTNVHIFQTMAPKGLGCIDHSVSRRLAQKLRALQLLLNDPDLHEIALDEEEAEEPIDYAVDQQDVLDLIEELEGKAEYDEEAAE